MECLMLGKPTVNSVNVEVVLYLQYSFQSELLVRIDGSNCYH